MTVPSVVSLVMAAALVTTSVEQTQAQILSEKDRAGVRAFADRDSALVMSRNWDGLAAEYAVDAVRMPPNAPAIQGRAAIRRAFEQLPPISRFSFHLVHLDGDGTTAYLRGTYTVTVTPPGLPKPIMDAGKVLAVFRKQPNGTWLCVAEAWNSDLPPSQ